MRQGKSHISWHLLRKIKISPSQLIGIRFIAFESTSSGLAPSTFSRKGIDPVLGIPLMMKFILEIALVKLDRECLPEGILIL